ncbi:class I tRNA ligase family protein, partial [Candidatus Hodgkinia cicadicola]
MYTNIVYSPYIKVNNDENKFSVLNVQKYSEIISPPPNITGELHIGHILNLILQRIYCIWACKKIYNVGLLSGMDHAGIATKYMLLKRYKNVDNLEFWAWKRRITKIVILQIKKLIDDCIYVNKIRFTLDKSFNITTINAFIKLWYNHLVAFKEKLLFWDSKLQTTLSELEIYKNVRFKKHLMWKYVLCNGVNLVWKNNSWTLTNFITSSRVSTRVQISVLILNIKALDFCKFNSVKIIDTPSGNYINVLINIGEQIDSNIVNNWNTINGSLIFVVNSNKNLFYSLKEYLMLRVCNINYGFFLEHYCEKTN